MRKFLWVELGGFGDVLQDMAEVKLFKEKYPGIEVTLLVREQYSQFVMTQPWVDGVIGGYKKPIGVLLLTIKKVRAGKFEQMTDLKNAGGRSYMLNLFSGVKVFFDKNKFDFNIRDRSKPSIVALPEKLAEAKKILAPLPDKKLFACIGAGGTHLKLWHTKGWIEFLEHVRSKGWGIVLNGYGEIEEKIAEEIISSIGNKNVLNLVSKLDYISMAGVAHSCTFTVGNDTGPLHLAALGGVPSIGLFMCPFADKVRLTMPWFTEIAAVPEYIRIKWSDKNAPKLLDQLPASKVIECFNVLIHRLQPSRA